MVNRPKLVYVVAIPLVFYVALTALWVDWPSLEGAQLYAMAKHLVIVSLLVASLFFYLRIGCLATLAWCALVPFERYGALFQEFSAVLSGETLSLAFIDVARIVLLLAACLLSAALAFAAYFRPTTPGPANADA